jgi:CHAD domain-containing protein
MAKAKEIVGLDCEASAASGIRLVLTARLKEMCEFREAALDWSKIKGVHDMRVASRRLRSALRDFSPYLRGRKLQRAANRLKKLADALGAVRDQDVAIKALEELMEDAPANVSAGLEWFAGKRRREREKARQKLTNAIEEDALVKLQAEFDAALEDGIKAPRKRKIKSVGTESDSVVSFRQAGREIIERSFQELEDLSASLNRPFKSKPLHQMRIAAKRTRYAIELFASCWGERLLTFAEEIAEMQTSLGELHDCDVWIEELGAVLREQRQADDDDSSQAGETQQEALVDDKQGQRRRAAVWLMRRFVESRGKNFGDALARWHDWETSDFHERLSRILRSEQTPVELSSLTLSPAEAVTADIEASGTS